MINADVLDMLDYKIDYDNKGREKSRKILQTIRNHEIVMDNDKRFAGKIKYDEFAQQINLSGCVPWDSEDRCRAWSSHDDSALFGILQSDYGLTNRNDYYDAIKNVSMRNCYHPVRQMLDALSWDGVEHIDTLLSDYLGASTSEYTRQVTRLWLLGGVSRIYEPGCKFDYTLILTGPQGIGKSTFLRRMALCDDWYNDSLDSLDSDKAAQSLVGSWIIELAELKSLARTSGGTDSVKRFLTAQQDKYRLPYERRADIFKRQCIFAGTTNKSDFLSDDTGNRRFLVVPTGLTKPQKDLFAPEVMEDIQQAWAQAVHIYKTQKPVLVLPSSCQDEAQQLQEDSMVDDGMTGLIIGYLADRQRTCVLEIWEQALGEIGRPQRWQASQIVNTVLSIPGWERVKSPTRYGKYGMQKLLQKTVTNQLPSDQKNDYHPDDFVPISTADQIELPFK